MYELRDDEPELDPVDERLNAIFKIEETLDYQLKLGEAAIYITELAERPDLDEEATWQSRVVLLGQVGVTGINQHGLFAGTRLSLTAYTKLSTGHRYAHFVMAGASHPDRYLLAARNPKLALSGVDQNTALRDRRVCDLISSAEFYRGRAENAVESARAKEPALVRIPAWPRDDVA